MNPDLSGLLALVGATFRNPQAVATDLAARDFDRGTLWSMLLAVTAVSVLVLVGSMFLLPPPPQATPEAGLLQVSPFALAAILGASLVMMVFALHFTGQALGGQGSFPATLLLIIWWQVMAIAVQLVQLLALVLLPPLAGLISLAGFVYLFAALVQFVNVLHVFHSVPKALGTIIVAVVGIGVGLTVILLLVGVASQGRVI